MTEPIRNPQSAIRNHSSFVIRHSSFVMRLLHLHREELGLAFLLFVYLFLILFSNIAAKVVGDTLILTHIREDKLRDVLPYFYIIAALFVGIWVFAYTKLLRVVSNYYLILGTLLGAGLQIAIFYFMLHKFGSWVAVVIYVWSRVHSAIAPAQVWIVASDLFTTREAKRVFGFMGTGGILGGIGGGFYSLYVGDLVGRKGADFLLLSIIPFLIASMVVVNLIWVRYRKRMAERRQERSQSPAEAPQARESVALVTRNRYLLWIAAIVALAAVVTTLIDYQFKVLVQRHYQTEEDYKQFFGLFYSSLGILSFFLQILFTAHILKWWGLRVSIMLLPFGLFLGSFSILIWPTLIGSVVFAKFLDGSFRHSVDRSSVELLYLPVSSQIKNQVKAFIDMVVWRVADGVGGLLLIAITFVTSTVLKRSPAEQIRDVSVVSLLLIAAWIYCALMARRDYHRTIRQTLEKRQISSEMLQPVINDPTTVKLIEQALKSGDERHILYALDVVDKTGTDACRLALKDLLDHPSKLVAVKAMQLLENCENFYPELRQLLHHERVDIRAHFLHLLNRIGNRQDKTLARTLLNDPNWKNVSTALAYLSMFRPSGEWYLTEARAATIASDRSADSAEARVYLAHVIGALRQPAYRHILEELLTSEEPTIRNAALMAVGESKDSALAGHLVNALERRETRGAATQALARLDDEGLPVLEQLLTDKKRSEVARASAATALSMMPSVQAANVLLDHLERDNQWLEYRIVKTLSKWRAANPEKELDRERIQKALEYQAREYYRLTTVLYPLSTRTETQDGMRLLLRALRDRMEQRLERIFRVLGWEHPQLEVYYCYLGLKSSNAQLQANAIEYMENLLDISRKRMLMPIFEDPELEQVAASGRRIYGFKPLSPDMALKEAFAAPDSWIRSCAIFSAAQLGLRTLSPEIIANLKNSDAIVRETAIFALKQMNIHMTK